MALRAGQLLGGRYRIQETLGQGGMGVVFLATDESNNGQRVAVKSTDLSRWGPSQREGLLDQFRREAKTLLRLEHPQLPRFLDFLEESEAYLVMEYIPGVNLAQHVDEVGPLEERQVLTYLGQLAEVLHYLHTQSPPVIFRDLKPSNIMLTPQGQLKLIDFGLAKDQEVGTSSLTQSSARGLVSPGFSAPEQYAGGTDERSDLYALGATAYFLLSGNVPAESIHLATQGGGPVSLDTLNAQVSPRTARLVQRLMQLRRDARPATAQDVLRELAAPGKASVEVETRVSQPSAAPPPPPTRRRKVLWALGITMVGGLGILRWWPRNLAPLSIITTPPGARVILDGQERGETPCNLTLQGSKGAIRLEKEGYFPFTDLIHPALPSQLEVALRPGKLSGSVTDTAVPGFYPPPLGLAPGAYFTRKKLNLQGYPYALPPDWAVVDNGPASLTVQSGDGKYGTMRKARLTLTDWAPPARRLRDLSKEWQEQNWNPVRTLVDERRGITYLELQQGPVAGRAALSVCAIELKGSRKLVELSLEIRPSMDVYDFIRHVDLVQGYMGP